MRKLFHFQDIRPDLMGCRFILFNRYLLSKMTVAQSILRGVLILSGIVSLLTGYWENLCFDTIQAAETRLPEIQRIEKSWANNQETFSQMTTEIDVFADLNLLCFPNAKRVLAENVDAASFLTDGNAGVLGGEGRVVIHGTPSRIVYYLGKPQKISAIRIFSGNIDTRGNQDFEIRLANNASNPGTMPDFPEEPTFTSGDTVVGGNGGGFMTSFEKNDDSPLLDGNYDWIEFRFWRTYDVPAGKPGKAQSEAASWGALIELQVLGDPNDPDLFVCEEDRKRWNEQRNLRRFERELDKLGPDVAFAVKNRDSLRLAIEYLTETYQDEYEGSDYLERWESFDKRFMETGSDFQEMISLTREYNEFRREVLLSNPILDFDKILLRKATDPALQANWISNVSRGKGEYDNALVWLNMDDLNGPLEEITRGRRNSYIGDISLHWDADRCLVTSLSDTNTWQVYECDLENGSLRQVTPEMGGDVDNVEGCYVPDGSTV
ncbi:MAG: hypothetical protein IKW74_01715, partial [Thermoguttaceae bacterium]|nr:hypothetical protein [Thermoguttaceae bacterium]